MFSNIPALRGKSWNLCSTGRRISRPAAWKQGSILNAGVSADVEPQCGASSVLRTLALCDLVDSTGLVERLGDLAAAELIRKHDRLARTLADRHGGREIDKTDGFLMMFERPVQAVGFALDYQRGLRQLNAAENIALAARVGIHVGDVVMWDNSAEDIARGAKPVEVEGLVKPITSRLMSLALPGQILLSNIAYDLAHRAQAELGEKLANLRWRTHGRYRFRGVPEPVPVFEVGEEGMAPLKAPPWSSKAHREVPFWRRPATVVIETLVLVALIAVPLVLFLRPDPAIAFAKRDWVVVGSLNNLTSETIFDDALESALRIGLEQSRYVNVMPDLKIRDTLARMQRDPDKTSIDRAVGSEIAIRDSARALILPTIAEIGGRVRITAEVVDPQTKTTVYSETADGIGKESILSSLDTINSRLRVRLGEALATVSSESKPLEKVATKNIDALKAYSLAMEVDNSGDTLQANILLGNAISIDPEFARAHIQLAESLLVQGKRAEAKQHLLTALALSDRLATRDRFMAEALLADFTSPRLALQKWKATSSSYPDFFPAQGSYGYFSWTYANDFREAIAATKRNAVPQNPNRATGYYLLGALFTGVEKYPEAQAAFTESDRLGIRYQNMYYAALYAAERKFDRIPELLAKGRSSDTSADKLSSWTFKLSFALDQGQWDKAKSTLIDAESLKPHLDQSQQEILRDVETNAAMILQPSADHAGTLQGTIPKPDSSTATMGHDDDLFSRSASQLFRAFVAARSSNAAEATILLGKLDPDSINGDFPDLAKMHGLVLAQQSLASGDAQSAIARLNALVDGNELNVTHFLLMEALAANGDFAGARTQAGWLALHRGRAYAQSSMNAIFMPFDVAQANLALLYGAEYSAKLKEPDKAREQLADFRQRWPTKKSPDWISARVDALEHELTSSAAASVVH
jgi:putative peptide modification system cyclase